LGADFNSIVHKDQVVAKVDPTLFEALVAQSKANLANAKAQLGKDEVNLQYQKLTYQRNQDLRQRGIISQDAFDASKTAADQGAAQVELSKAQIEQATAQLNQSQTNLEHTVITSPIDGIVTQRSVDVGQTVAASMTAPVLFIIAADLTKMQVSANIDESDVGRVRPGQTVTFRVDAYPGEEFRGTVAQIRLNPIVVNNVTTYATMINVPNNDFRLKPGMTANLKVQVSREADALRVPNSALRFRPSVDVFAALNEPVPQEALGTGRGGRGSQGGGRNAGGAGSRGTDPSPASAATGATPADAGRGDDRQQRQIDRFKAMSSDAQREFIARLDERGVDSTPFVQLMNQPASAGNGGKKDAPKKDSAKQGTAKQDPAAKEKSAAAKAAADAAKAFMPKYGAPQSAETIDALFAPLPTVESRGRVWVFMNQQLKPVNIRLGITDGTYTELLSSELQQNMEVVTGVTGLSSSRVTAAQGGGNPLMPQQRGGFGGPGRGR
ncbi:MAG TPA: efflux RND transporter periplasmic adaptor subunit, partial [Vicinamibacterales bacterium]|nr:efflux RND transporter periplasmic adaptor subunit [Vicinamibacterales bacterium]